jgi:chromosome segregation ATPase
MEIKIDTSGLVQNFDVVTIDGKQYVPQSWLGDARKPYADHIVKLEKERDELNAMNSELNEAVRTLTADYRIIRDNRDTLKRRVHDLQNTKEPMLNDAEWAALERAEAPLYTPFNGYHAYTDVMERQDGQLAAAVWAQAEMAVEMSFENWDSWSSATRRSRIAHRVAQTLAVISFGPEFLLK